jgi:hypothetical protein
MSPKTLTVSLYLYLTSEKLVLYLLLITTHSSSLYSPQLACDQRSTLDPCLFASVRGSSRSITRRPQAVPSALVASATGFNAFSIANATRQLCLIG